MTSINLAFTQCSVVSVDHGILLEIRLYMVAKVDNTFFLFSWSWTWSAQSSDPLRPFTSWHSDSFFSWPKHPSYFPNKMLMIYQWLLKGFYNLYQYRGFIIVVLGNLWFQVYSKSRFSLRFRESGESAEINVLGAELILFVRPE